MSRRADSRPHGLTRASIALTKPWPLFWTSFALMLFGMALIFLGSWPVIEAGAGGLAAPETRSGGYSEADLAAYVAALTSEARDAYLGPQRIADTLFPLGLLGTLALGTFLALRRFSAAVAALASLPAFVYFVFDMIENSSFANVLRFGVTPELAARADHATRMKFVFIDIALAVLALALVLRLVARLRAGRRQEHGQ